MARGTSRSPSRNQAARASSARGLPGWLWSILCVVIGVFIARYFFNDTDKAPSRAPTPPVAAPSAPQTPSAPNKPPSTSGTHSAGNSDPSPSTAKDATKQEEQNFDFYTILPSSEVAATNAPAATITAPSALPPRTAPVVTSAPPAVATAPTASAAAPSPATAPASGSPSTMTDRYLLQSLSTGSEESANTVAGRLRDLGVPTQVRAAQLANGKTTYRVQSGPFREGAERDRALGLIRVQHLNPIVIKAR